VASMAARHFTSDRLRQAFSFQTLYLGTRPERVPAAYVMIPFVEAAMGVWYPRGGIHTIATAMARVAGELGVRVHHGHPVSRIVTEGARAVGVALPGGSVAKADAVVANAEWGYTQRTLLPRGERVTGRDWGCSGVLFLWAVRRRVEACREIQEARYAGRGSRTNGTVRSGTAEMLRELTPEAAAFLTRAAERLSLSGRAIGKACRVARTIADLAGERRAGLPHAAEALQYRLSGFG